MQSYSKDMDSYVMDVYVDVAPKHRVWLIDFNPWIPGCVDSLLYEWEELEAEGNEEEKDIRVIEDNK